MSKILIIEDEVAIRRVLSKIIKEENKSYIVDTAEDGLQGYQMALSEDYDLIICDIKMPKMDGVEVLEKIKSDNYETVFVMISGHGDIDLAIETMRKGAFDYISKPPDLNRFLTTVRNALDKKELTTENKILKKMVSKKYDMIGDSPEINKVKDIVEKVAITDARVLITGDNGTGKELVAHWIHQKSERRGHPMVEVNCAAIPSELIESELFGHIKGAFTGAAKDRSGKFEAANGGTIFLDEIGDMSMSAQAKVLRVLQDSVINRVGSDKKIKVDVRVIAATNKDLKEEISNGRFREDLYHRLAVIIVKVPNLNQRKEDIPLLIDFFLDQIAKEQGSAKKKFSKNAIELMKSYDWTGNIRELRNVVERLMILGEREITESDVKLFANKEPSSLT